MPRERGPHRGCCGGFAPAGAGCRTSLRTRATPLVNPETRSELAIPMIHKNRVMGVLDLESPQLNYFTEEHVQTLSVWRPIGGFAGKRAAL